jgi:predicted nucleic acid binding AN1-type Zn finger protein
LTDKCHFCGHIAFNVYKCSYCGKKFCQFHNDQRDHNCKPYLKWRKKVLGQ